MPASAGSPRRRIRAPGQPSNEHENGPGRPREGESGAGPVSLPGDREEVGRPAKVRELGRQPISVTRIPPLLPEAILKERQPDWRSPTELPGLESRVAPWAAARARERTVRVGGGAVPMGATGMSAPARLTVR